MGKVVPLFFLGCVLRPSVCLGWDGALEKFRHHLRLCRWDLWNWRSWRGHRRWKRCTRKLGGLLSSSFWLPGGTTHTRGHHTGELIGLLRNLVAENAVFSDRVDAAASRLHQLCSRFHLGKAGTLIGMMQWVRELAVDLWRSDCNWCGSIESPMKMRSHWSGRRGDCTLCRGFGVICSRFSRYLLLIIEYYGMPISIEYTWNTRGNTYTPM